MMVISIRSTRIPTFLYLSLSIPTTQWKRYIFRFGTHLCKEIVELINEYQCFEWLDTKQPLVKCIGCQTDVLSTESSVSSVNEWILNANDFMNSCSESRMISLHRWYACQIAHRSNEICFHLNSFLLPQPRPQPNPIIYTVSKPWKTENRKSRAWRALNTLPICYIVSTDRTVNLVSIIEFKPNSWID